MDTYMKSQILKLSLIAALLVVTPLLSTSLRSPYLYFVFNLLIITLGAEAGLLSFSKPTEQKKVAILELSSDNDVSSNTLNGTLPSPEFTQKRVKMVEKSFSKKIVGTVKVAKVKKCPSTPSLFFIGGGETEAEEVDDDEEEEKEELFVKAETFIGNFYKQLKMQREESWKRIHGLYYKAF